MAYLLVGLFAIVLVLGVPQSPVAAQEGWVIERFNATYDIQADGSVQVSERIEVDFRSLRRNGIFRDLLIEQEYDAESNRIYRVQVQSVASAIGERRTFRLFDRDPFLRIRIGDEARLVTGRETYVISYRLEGALNGFDDHDELFWNVLGFDWPVPINETRVTVTAPEGFQRAACFQGRRGSTQPCNVEDLSSAVIHFASTRGYKSGENMTIIASIDKGIVDDPKPILEDKPRQFPVGYFVFEPLSSVAALLVVLGGFGFVGWVWYSTGRDRRYTTTHYLTGDTDEAIGPLFGQDQVVVEYTPPEGLLPGEIGLLIDERVDTKDVTATIIDLAVRGYLEIEEVEPKWLLANFFGTGKDWTLKKKREADDLKLYERTVFKGLFKAGATSVELSDLKTKFHTTLEKAQKQLYKAATRDGWFRGNPSSTRTRWRGIGGGLFVAGLLTALGTWLAVRRWNRRNRPRACRSGCLLHGRLDAGSHGEGKRNPAANQRFRTLHRNGRIAPAGVQREGEHLRRVSSLRHRLRLCRSMGEGIRGHRHDPIHLNLVSRRYPILCGRVCQPFDELQYLDRHHDRQHSRRVGRLRIRRRRLFRRRRWRRRWRKLERSIHETQHRACRSRGPARKGGALAD